MRGISFLIIAGKSDGIANLIESLQLLDLADDSVMKVESVHSSLPDLTFKPSFIFLAATENVISDINTLKIQYNTTPIVVVGNSADTLLISAAIEAGAHDFIELSKPNALQLEKAIQIAISRSGYYNMLEDKAQSFERIKQNSINAIFTSLPDGTILEANNVAEKMFGYTEAELKAIGRQGIFDHTDPNLIRHLNTRNAEGKVRGEAFGIRKNGEHFIVEFSSVVYKNNIGESRISTIVLDITDRKEAEKEKDILIKSTEESFSLISKDLKIISYNHQFALRYKHFFNKDINKGDSILDYVQPGRVDIVKEIYQKVLAGEVAESEITVPFNGNVYTYFNSYKPAYDNDGKLYGVFVSSVDVTEQRKISNLLLASEKRFRLLIENSEDMIMLMDANRLVSYISPSFTKILGYSTQDILGKRPLNFTHPDFQAQTLAISNMAAENPGVKYSYLSRVAKKDGSYIYIEGTVINLLKVDGVNALVNNFIDITEQKTAQNLLESSELKYRTLFDLSPTPMFTYDDTTFEFIEINKAALEFYGFSEEEMRAMDVITMRPEYDWENTRNNIESHRDVDFYHLQTIHKKHDGTIVNVQVYNNRVTINNRVQRLVQINDVTPILMMEEERERANNALRLLNEQIQKRAAELEETNNELRKIAWMQSHLVRAPLARILGLIDILHDNDDTVDTVEILSKIKESSIELDSVIREIVVKTDSVNTQQVGETGSTIGR